mmetsp:Transcript_10786/g.1631  ORF Transcript_10786/g.1631 Transcript_10786/m.1631 type:complete len:81 (+) Transcript_10786:338-580(+)
MSEYIRKNRNEEEERSINSPLIESPNILFTKLVVNKMVRPIHIGPYRSAPPSRNLLGVNGAKDFISLPRTNSVLVLKYGR